MTSGLRSADNDGGGRHLHGDIGAEEDAQEPVRANPQGHGLDSTERTHGEDPELNTRETDHPPRIGVVSRGSQTSGSRNAEISIEFY